MALPDTFIEELNRRSSIEDLVSSYVNLHTRGRTRVGLCPFHGEKTPSFTVYPENNSFYCFGCGAGGDVITFVRKIEHLDYMDAVRFLADRAGMEMPKTNVDDGASRLRRRVLEANREAARFFYEQLSTAGGSHALDYFRSRGYSDRTIRRFGLGYAPDGFHALLDHLRKKGFRDEELLLAWLVRRSSEKGNLYDSFRNRVMIPIIDVRGNVIAFGGRVLDDSKPKYVNTGDTPVFKKTNNLFALNIAKDTGRRLILCEGYMDVIALHQAGFPNAVAALGTSFTVDHANLIARYADEVVLIFDADAAGQKGASRAISLLRQTGVTIRVVRIPDGKDPDEFLRHHPPEAFKLLVDRSANDVEYRLATLRQQYDVTLNDGKIAFLNEAIQLIAGLHSPVERDVYAAKLASELAVAKSAIVEQLNGVIRKREKRREKQQLKQALRHQETMTAKVLPEAGQYPRAIAAEEALIGTMLLHTDRIRDVAGMLNTSDWFGELHRKVFERLCARDREGLMVSLPLLASDFNEDEMAYLSRLYQTAQTRDDSKTDIQAYVDVLHSERTMQALASPDTLNDDDLRAMMNALRDSKQ